MRTFFAILSFIYVLDLLTSSTLLLLCLVFLTYCIEFVYIVGVPEPGHVVMRKHNTFWISGSATSVNDIATHSRPLILNFLINNSIFYFAAKLHNLTPIKNFKVLRLVKVSGLLRMKTFSKNEASFNT